MTLSFYETSKCGRDLLTADIVFITLGFIVLGLRLWSARYSGRKLWWDDLLVVIAFISKFALASTALWATLNGLGKHLNELNLDQLTIQVKLLLVSEFTYLVSTACIKLSMLCLYHRIYTTPTFRRWCHVLIALNVGYIVSFIPLFLTNCIPLSQYWDPKPTGWCRDTLISDNATVAVNLVLDVLVLALPLPVLWRLQMSVRDKLTVTSMFSLGFATIALVLWRLSVTQRTRDSPDWTATLCEVGVIGVLEVHIGILAVCIPTLGPLFNGYVKPIFNRLGIMKTGNATKTGGKKSFLETIGGSGSKKRTHKSYTEFNDSIDHIISRDDNSIKLTPTGEGKVVVDVSSEPVQNFRTPSHINNSGIHVKRDIEWHPQKGAHYDV